MVITPVRNHSMLIWSSFLIINAEKSYAASCDIHF